MLSYINQELIWRSQSWIGGSCISKKSAKKSSPIGLEMDFDSRSVGSIVGSYFEIR